MYVCMYVYYTHMFVKAVDAVRELLPWIESSMHACMYVCMYTVELTDGPY
jgi:hypothetical protein